MALRYENGQYVLDGVKKAGTQSASDRLAIQKQREETQKNQQTTTKPTTQQNTTTASKKQGGFLYDAISRIVGDAEFEVRSRVLANQEAEKEFPVLNNTVGKKETEAAIAANQDIITSFDSKWKEISQNGRLSPEQKQAAVSDLYKQVRDAEEAIYNAQTAERELEAAKKAQDRARQDYADAVYKGLVKERLESVKDSEDFDEYRQKGAETETDANIVKWVQSVNAPGSAMEKQYYMDLYRFLTDEELGVYEYYVGKGDVARADRYMTNVIKPILQERQAQSKADAVNDMEGVSKTLATMLVGTEAGYYNFLTGLVGVAESIGNALGYETEPYQPVLELTYQKVIQDAGGVDKLLGELAYNIGSNAPAMFTGQVSSGLGRAMFGGSVYGNSYREAKEAGVEEAVAHLYSALNTAAELGLETVLGGIPGVSGKNGLASKIGKSIQKVTDGFVKNPTIARLIYTGAKMASGGMGEGVEEYLQSIINPALQNFLLGAENEIQLLSQESMDSALVGLLMGIVMNGMAGGNLTTGQRKALSQREAEYLTKQYEDIVQRIGADSPKAAQAYEDMMDALTANAVLDMEATAADVISASQNDGMNTDSIVQDNGMRAAILNPENTAELYQYFGKDTTRYMIEAAKAYESPASVAQRARMTATNVSRSLRDWMNSQKENGAPAFFDSEQLVEFLSSKGINTRFFNDPNSRVKAYVSGNDMTINEGAEGSVISAAIHELGHSTKSGNPKEYQKVLNAVKRLVSNDPTLANIAGGIIEDYSALENGTYLLNDDGSLNRDLADEELVMNIMEHVIKNPESVLQAVSQERGLARTVLDWLRGIKNNIAIKLTNSEKAMLDEAGRLFTNMLRGETDSGTFRKYDIVKANDGKDIVVITDNIFEGKDGEKPHKIVRDYIRRNIGMVYDIAQDGTRVYIGKDLPNEYTQSKATLRLSRHDKRIKNQAAQNLGELIEVSKGGRYVSNKKQKHSKDAKYGWYRYDTRFVFPKKNKKGFVVDYLVYNAEMLIRHDEDGRKYLYDMLKIKEAPRPVASTLIGSAIKKAAGAPLTVSTVSQNSSDVNNIMGAEGKNNTKQAIKTGDTGNGYDGLSWDEIISKAISRVNTANEVKNLAAQTNDVSEIEQQSNQSAGTPTVAENETVDPTGSGQQRYISQTAQRLVSADYVPSNVGAELIDEIRNGTFTYEVSTDADAEKSALDKIARNGVQGAVSIFSNAVENGNAGKADIALGEVLLRQALQARDVETSMQLIADLAIAGRQAGQSLQAMTMLNKLTPDGRLYTLEKMVMHMQEDLDRNRGSKAPTLRISPELAEKLLFAKDAEEADTAEDDIVKDIAKQIPATLAEKWNAWRYLAMLGNPKTHFRNIIGNATFIPIRNLKNAIKAGLESLDVKRGKMQQSERTASVTTDKASRDYARADFENVKDIASGAGKYNDAKSRVNDARKIFDSKFLEKPRNWNGNWLEGEDIFFLKRAYANSFAQAMKARGITVDQLKDGTPGAQRKLNSLREYAIREAQKSTFREASAVADALNRMKKMPGIGAVLEGVLPFTKTPINITKRSLEYSPVGLFKSFYDLARNTKRTTTDRRYKTREQALDEMASGLTGTGVLLLGMLARALDIVNGKEEDENKASYMNMLGLQNYSINVGDSTYTLNWLAPASIPFFTGVNLFDAIEGEYDGMSAVEVVSNFATPALDPLLEMSMLQGVNDLIDNVRFEDSSIPAVLINSATGYVSQGVPTLFGALARTFDDTRRSKYTDKTTGIPAGAQKFMQNVQAKIPGLENMLNEYVDFWGRTEEEKNILVRAFENLVSPGYISNKNTSDVDVELLRLYDATGEVGVLPSYAPKYFNVKGKRLDLSSEQYVTYQKERGTLAFDIMDEMVHSEDYERLTDIEKAEAAEMVLDYANDVAKTKVSDYSMDGTNKKIFEASQKGVPPVYSIISRVMTGTASDAAGKKNLTNAEIVEALGGKSSPETIISNLNETAQQKYEKAKRMDISSKQFVDAVVAMSEYDSKSNQLSALKSIGLTSKKAFSLYYVMSGKTETPAVKLGRQKAIDSGISETKFYDMYMSLGGTKRGKQESYDILRQSGFSSADAKTFLLSMWDYKKTGYEE